MNINWLENRKKLPIYFINYLIIYLNKLKFFSSSSSATLFVTGIFQFKGI